MNGSFDGAIAFARDLIRIPGLSGRESAVADRVEREFRDLGFQDVRRDHVGNVVGVVRGTDGGPSILLNCHMDVVAEGDPATWEHPPFDGVVADGFLHGRGAMDIKGPLALQTHAAAALAGRTPGDVIVAHTVFEERGGLGMKELLADGSLRPDLCIIGESTHGDVCIGHRGRAEVEVVIRGRAGHASAPERAANALTLLPGVLEAVDAAARDLPSDPILGPSTLAATMVDVRPESRNVVPDEVVVAIDWRILPGMDEPALLDRIRAAVAARLPEVPPGLGLEVRMASETQRCYTGFEGDSSLLTPGFLIDPDDPIVRGACRIVGRRDGDGDAVARPWTFATDGGWSAGVYGIPSIGFAPGEERHAHTNTERLDLAEARWCWDRHLELIPGLQALLGG